MWVWGSLFCFVWGLSIRWYSYWGYLGYICKRLCLCFIWWGVYCVIYCVLLCTIVFILIYIFGVIIMTLVVRWLVNVGVVRFCFAR